MEKRILVIGELTIKNGKAAELKKQIPAIIDAVRNNEPELNVYEWFIKSDETKCFIVQRFENSEAFLNHLSLMAPMLPALFAIAPFSGWKIYGNLTPAALETIRPIAAANNIVPDVYEFLEGMVRDPSISDKQLV